MVSKADKGTFYFTLLCLRLWLWFGVRGGGWGGRGFVDFAEDVGEFDAGLFGQFVHGGFAMQAADEEHDHAVERQEEHAERQRQQQRGCGIEGPLFAGDDAHPAHAHEEGEQGLEGEEGEDAEGAVVGGHRSVVDIGIGAAAGDIEVAVVHRAADEGEDHFQDEQRGGAERHPPVELIGPDGCGQDRHDKAPFDRIAPAGVRGPVTHTCRQCNPVHGSVKRSMTRSMTHDAAINGRTHHAMRRRGRVAKSLMKFRGCAPVLRRWSKRDRGSMM